jgi:anti-sigma B factor antagonist
VLANQNQELLIDGPLVVAWNRYGQDVVVVALAGEMDRANVGSAHRVIEEVTTGDADEILVVDLSALEFIDSSGIELLVGLARDDRAGEGLRVVPSDAPAVARIMSVTGVDAMIRIARDRPRQAA